MGHAAFRAYTDAEITTAIATWKAALNAVSVGQSYSIAGRTLTRADARFITDTLGNFQEEKERRDGSTPPRTTYADHSGGIL